MKTTVCKARYFLLTALSAIYFTAAVCIPLTCAATRGSAMESAFFIYADTSASGVTQASYRTLSAGITGYLGGKTETAQVLVARYGIPGDAFSKKELSHLKDVRGLIAAAVCVSWLLGAFLAASVIFLAIRDFGKNKRLEKQAENLLICRSIITGFMLLAAAAAAAAIWAAVDFNGIFILFHQVLFSNSLWMLDPATDLLIQLMPLGFFRHYAIKVLLGWFALDLALLLPAVVYLIMRRKHDI
jgi:integral membrane protein (TIGR01906 family)